MSSAGPLAVRPLSRLFKALADETRLRIVAALAHGELCVCHLECALGLPQPTVSRQLAVLRAAGVVADRRAGSWIHYRLLAQADPEVEHVLQSLVRAFAGRTVVQRSVQKALRARGPGTCK